MRQVGCNPNFSEVFTHNETDKGIYRTFLTGIMREYAMSCVPCAGISPNKIPLTDDLVQKVTGSNHPEQERLERLVDPFLHYPIIAIHWEDHATTTIIDGTHRIMRLHQLGEPHVLCYLFHYPFWQQFTLQGLSHGINELMFQTNLQQSNFARVDEYNRRRIG